MSTQLLGVLITELHEADESAKRQLASHLRPYLGNDPDRLLNARAAGSSP
jgi:hypothetical protein